MNEVKKVHLGRQQFTISVEAHKDLRDYLAAIEKQPGVQPEVTKEVEMRMAELLTERGITADKVVLQEDVDFLKQQLGEPRDFKDEDGKDDATEMSDKTKKDEDQPRRLYRDTQNGWIAGVASGLAAYLGIDVLIVRIIFVALTFASGAGILVYILIWLLAPEAKTPSERLQMQGKAVTVDSLKEIVDRADIAGASQRAGRNFGYFIGKTFEVIARIILLIIGSAFVVAGTITMLGTVAAGVYLLIHGGQIGTDIAFPLGSREVWFVILAFMSAAILGFFMLMIGLTMASRKWRLPGWLVATLVGIFFVAASVGTALGFDTIPHIRDRFRAAHHSQTRDMQEFKNLSLTGQDTNFRFTPDTKYYVEFSYLGNVDTKPLITTVEGGTLTIDSDGFMKTPLCNGLCFYSSHDLQVTIHAPSLDKVSVSGKENSFNVASPLNQTDMSITVRRDSSNQVRLGYLEAASAEVTDDNTKDWNLKLSGIKRSETVGSSIASINDENHVVQLTAIDMLQLNTTNTCDESEPLVYVGATAKEIRINSDLVKSGTGPQLQDLRSADKNNIYNCVIIR